MSLQNAGITFNESSDAKIIKEEEILVEELMAEMAKKLDIPLKGQNELGRTRIELTKKLRLIIEGKFPQGKHSLQKLGSEGITPNESSDARLIHNKSDLK